MVPGEDAARRHEGGLLAHRPREPVVVSSFSTGSGAGCGWQEFLGEVQLPRMWIATQATCGDPVIFSYKNRFLRDN